MNGVNPLWMGQEAVVQLALVYLLLAFSVHVAAKVGMLSLAGVACYGVGAYTTGYLTMQGTPVLLAVVASAAGAGAIGLLLGYVLARLQGLYLAMSTFALVLLVQILAVEWEPVTGGALGLLGLPLGVTTEVVLVVVVLVSLGLALLERGRSGSAMEAVRLDPALAESMGIHVARVRRATFTLSAALGGIAGSFSAMLYGIFTPQDVSFHLIVDVLTMIVIGGTAAWYGPVIGAAFVAWLPEILSFAGTDRAILQAALVVVVVVLAPQGGVGLIQSGMRRLGRRRADPDSSPERAEVKEHST
jgi:branched-chain amino acid transport system permease protein